MSDIRRVWTAEELDKALTRGQIDTEKQLNTLLEYLAQCTRLMTEFQKMTSNSKAAFINSYGGEWDCGYENAVNQLRAALEEGEG